MKWIEKIITAIVIAVITAAFLILLFTVIDRISGTILRGLPASTLNDIEKKESLNPLYIRTVDEHEYVTRSHGAMVHHAGCPCQESD